MVCCFVSSKLTTLPVNKVILNFTMVGHPRRGYAAGIYTTNSPDACYHCLESSRANICAVQDKKQLDKILSVRSRLKHLKAIVQWKGPVDTSIPGVYSVSLPFIPYANIDNWQYHYSGLFCNKFCFLCPVSLTTFNFYLQCLFMECLRNHVL